jgi:glycosyltransferase involved in cell wall biosynthesis
VTVTTGHTVLHILGSGSRGGSAQARIVRDLARGLGPQSYHLRAWFTEGDGALVQRLAAEGVESRVVPFGGARDATGVSRMARALRCERPAIVHLHVGGRSLVWLTRSLSAARTVVHLHASHDDWGQPLPLRSFARSAAVVMATSGFVASLVDRSATVVYPGVELRECGDAPRMSHSRTIGAAGRLVPVKGYAHLLQAAHRLQAKGIDVRVEIAGDGPCAGQLDRLSRRLALGDRVSLLGWRDDIWDLHRRWEVFVAPSLQEGFGLAALEAMGSGLPVVGSSVGGMPELVEDQRTGFLVPPGNADALADRLGRVLADPPLRARRGEAGRNRAARCFSAERMVAEVKAVYDALLART